jgi:hypothetical protein
MDIAARTSPGLKKPDKPWFSCGCCPGATRLNVMQCNLLEFSGNNLVK